jgi:hypothetical protein
VARNAATDSETTCGRRKSSAASNHRRKKSSPKKNHRQKKSSIVTDDKSESWNDLDETHPAAGDACRFVAGQQLEWGIARG